MRIFSSAVAPSLVEATPKTPSPTPETDTSTPPPATTPSENNPPPAESQAVPEVEKVEEPKEKPLEPAVSEDITLPIEEDKKTPDQALPVSEPSKCQKNDSVSESNKESADISSDSVEKEAAKVEKDESTTVVQTENGDNLTNQNTEEKEKIESPLVETSHSEEV